MHAIICDSFGDENVMRWGEYPAPAPAPGEVLIRVHAAGINRADILQRRGKYPPPTAASPILGLEVAGEISTLGSNVQNWQVGDKVMALLVGGGYAEYVAVPVGQCLPAPANLTLTECAALPEAMATVWANVFEAGALKQGETILVHGGSSGIGSFAIQMARLHGASVMTTSATAEKCKVCIDLGATHAINHLQQDFVVETLAATNGRGVDVVLDMVGGEYLPRNLAVLSSKGRHISIATQKGTAATIDLRLVMQKQLIVTGSTLRSRSPLEKTRLMQELATKALPWVLSGQLKPLIYNIYQKNQVAEAHKMMESGAHFGKLVIAIAS
jgi:NADPH2:quinone reductase